MYFATYRIDDQRIGQVALVSTDQAGGLGWADVGRRLLNELQTAAPLSISLRYWHEDGELRRLLLIQNSNDAPALEPLAARLVEASGGWLAPVLTREDFDELTASTSEVVAATDLRPFAWQDVSLSFPQRISSRLTALFSHEELRAETVVQLNARIAPVAPDDIAAIRRQFARNQHLADMPADVARLQDSLASELRQPVAVVEEYVGVKSPAMLNLLAQEMAADLPQMLQQATSNDRLFDATDDELCRDGFETGLLQVTDGPLELPAMLGHLMNEEELLRCFGVASAAKRPGPAGSATVDVFVSYSSRDANQALAACHFLEERGIRCWIAPRDILPGRPYAEEIVRGIEAASVMLLLYSESSDRSPHVLREVERAVHHGLVILPMRIEAADMSRNMEYLIGSCHWLDALEPPLDRHLQSLCDAINKILETRGD